MPPEDLRKLRIARRIRCSAQLLERLLLDRMGVGEVLDQLLVERVGGHLGSSMTDCIPQLVPPRRKLNLIAAQEGLASPECRLASTAFRLGSRSRPTRAASGSPGVSGARRARQWRAC